MSGVLPDQSSEEFSEDGSGCASSAALKPCSSEKCPAAAAADAADAGVGAPYLVKMASPVGPCRVKCVQMARGRSAKEATTRSAPPLETTPSLTRRPLSTRAV